MKVENAVIIMHIGMFIIIIGAITFLWTAKTDETLAGCMVAWACSSATAIFFAANNAINTLRREIKESEARRR